MVGMLVILSFIEKNQGISDDMLQELKWVTAGNAQEYLDKPSEDIFLMVEEMMKEMI